jgi:uncharacterized DUF497 family protein
MRHFTSKTLTLSPFQTPTRVVRSVLAVSRLTPEGRLLVTVYAHRAQKVRIISSRKASRAERRRYEESDA